MKGFLHLKALFFLSLVLMPLAQNAYAAPTLAEIQGIQTISEIRSRYPEGQVPPAVETQLAQAQSSLDQLSAISNIPGPFQNNAQLQQATSELARNLAAAQDAAKNNPAPESPSEDEPEEPQEPVHNQPSSEPSNEPSTTSNTGSDPSAQTNNSAPQSAFANSGIGTVGSGFGIGAGAGPGPGAGVGNRQARRVNDKVLRWGVCRLYKSVEGGMGGLFATIAGVLAVIFSVVGAFKAAWGFLLVAVGAFILRSLVSLFYGGNFNECNNQGQINGFNANLDNTFNTSGIT